MSEASSQRPLTVTQCCAGIAAVALAYVAFYQLNRWLFSTVEVSEHISWIFLPAAIRMVSVLLLGWTGVAGLYLGSLAVMGPMLESEPVRALIVAGISSVPCLLAARLVQRLRGLDRDLAGMTGRQLLLFGFAGGLASSGAHTLYFAYSAGSLAPLAGFVPMFVGDTAGTFLMLYLAVIALNRIVPPVREG